MASNILNLKMNRKEEKPNLNKGKNQAAKKNKSKLIFYICLMAIPMLQFVLFYVGVNFNSLLLAFKSYDYFTGGYSWIGFDNFKLAINSFITETSLISSIKNSLILYVFSVALGITLAVLFSYYIYKRRAFSGVFKVILFMPSILSSVVLVIMFKYFVESAVPIIWENIFNKKVDGLLQNNNTQFATILFYTIWAGFGAQILLFSGAMNEISPSSIEAASIDGITPLKELWYIVIPLIWPTLVTFLVVGVAGIFTNQMNLFSFYGTEANYNLYTFGYYIYRSMKATSTTIADYPYLSAIGIMLTFVSLPLTFIVRTLSEKFGPKTE